VEYGGAIDHVLITGFTIAKPCHAPVSILILTHILDSFLAGETIAIWGHGLESEPTAPEHLGPRLTVLTAR